MRTGLFKSFTTGDRDQDRLTAAVEIAVDQLAADHDLLSVPVTALSVSGQIAPGKSVVIYRGLPGAILSLPSASAQGQNTSAIILVGNVSPGAVTVQTTGIDLIGGVRTLSLGTGVCAVLVSDGISTWFSSGTGSGASLENIKAIASLHP